MPNDHHASGIERLENFVAQFPNWRKLSPEDLEVYKGRSFLAGWEIPELCEDRSLNLRILVDGGFPFRPPRIAVSPAPPFLSQPNLEKLGVLCLLGEGTASSTERIETLVMGLLVKAQNLVDGWQFEASQERFEDEFESYWSNWPLNTLKMISLCDIGGESRWVCACSDKKSTFVADDEKTLKRWLGNFFHNPEQKTDIKPIPLIKLSRVPRPAEYPKTAADLYALLKGDINARAMLQKFIFANKDKGKEVLLAFTGRQGSGFMGIFLPRANRDIEKGFRKGFLSPRVLMERLGTYPATGATVTRCDPSWVHGRDHNPDIKKLSSKTVILLGVGSLGSGVAELLAKMGVGRLVLVDPEEMATENASRHTLGVSAQRLKKAAVMAGYLSRHFPHSHFEPHCERWEDAYPYNPASFFSADLVISTVGSWSSESRLNVLANSTEGFAPILYGWLEEHAAAGHAFASFGGEGCIRCLTNDMGRPRVPVTSWPDGGTHKFVPMCGGTFQPYGAIELACSQSLVADLAADILLGRVTSSAHNVWIGQKKLLEPGRGGWHPDWIARYGDPEGGGRIVSIPIVRDAACPVCSGDDK